MPVLLVFLLATSGLAAADASGARQTLNFNPDRRFVKADPAGASAPGFDDAAWSVVSAPHTYNDVDTFDNWSTPGHRGEQIQWSGRTWYRKTFTAPAAWRGKKVFIEFEAVRQIGEVHLNGQLLGTHKTGFTPFLDLEAGINRVAIRASRTPGRITLRAKGAGLQPASATVASQAFAATDGIATAAPAFPSVALAATAPTHPNLTADVSIAKAKPATAAASIVHVEIDVANGRNVYVDRDFTFSDLPADLAGADWIQAGNADALYSAVDLIEFAVKGGSVVTLAHDARLAAPEWLTRQFQPTNRTLTVNGQSMKLYTRAMPADGSLTLGSNTEQRLAEARMYGVLVSAAR